MPHTEHGDTAVQVAQRELRARFGDAAVEHTPVIRVASFGPRRSGAESGAALVPFDPVLADALTVADALPHLRSATRSALRTQWLPLLTRILTARQPT